jgi:hypothetical protein
VTRWTYHLDVDRVIVHGVGGHRLDGNELRALVERAVARELGDASLPPGRTMRGAVQVTARSVSRGGAAGIAAAVASSISVAASGGPRRG